MRIMDIHAHTRYSFCGRDDPREVIRTAIEGGIELFGISDHNYGIGTRKKEYLAEMRGYREEYKDKITLLCGIEIATVPHLYDIEDGELSGFDYCLIEQVGQPDSLTEGCLLDFCDRLGIKTGIAHTDLFAVAESKGIDPLSFLTSLAEHGIFWEMNVNFDSIHGYREHTYVRRLFEDPVQQEIVRRSGIAISVGFDGHRIEDYLPERVKNACRAIDRLGFLPADTLFV